MRAGQLRQKIILQQKTTTRDAMGGETITWNDQATIPAAIEPLSGRELFLAQQTQAELNTRIRIRYRLDVNAGWRVKFGSRIFAIEQPPINPEMRNRELHLLCSEGLES